MQWPGFLPWADFSSLLMPVLVITLVSFLETASSAKVESQRSGERWNENQDLIGQGLSKISSGLCGSFATSASFSRSAINLYAGAQSGWATVFSILVVLVVLFGIALLFSFEALLWLLQFIADSNALQQIVFWTMGSLGRATWTKIGIVGMVLSLCLLWSARQAWALTALRAGEDQARSFGISVERLRLVTLLRVSLLAATALSFVGTIGFVGLVGPHIARMLLGEDHRYYLPGSALAGALMLSLASILSKALVPGVVLPIGIITALVGVPLFMTLVLRQRRAA